MLLLLFVEYLASRESPDKEKNAIEKKMRLVGKTPYTEG